MRTGRERLSTAFFLDADFDCVVDPADIPATCEPGVRVRARARLGILILILTCLTHQPFPHPAAPRCSAAACTMAESEPGTTPRVPRAL